MRIDNQKIARYRGFTLIELMVVVAIVGIIAAIAIPSYQSSVDKARRADAQGALVAFAASMERRFTENNSYCDSGTNAVTNCGGTAGDSGTPIYFPSQVPTDGGTAYYTLTISNVSSTSFTLTAQRKGVMDSDYCGDFTITNTGAQSIANADSGVTAAECWR